MFSAPATPALQPPPSPMAHHSRHRPNTSNNASNNNGAISQNNSNNNSNNNFGPGDIDDDVQPSSSSSPFPPPSPRPRTGGGGTSQQHAVAGPSSNFSRNSSISSAGGPQSPLSSPDSTFWGGAAPSPSPTTHSSYRGGPSTPGGMCVVSSSTVDDVPPSPFSPAEDSNHSISGSNTNGNSSVNSLSNMSNLLSNSISGGPAHGPSNNSGVSGNSSGGIIASNNGSLLVHHRISQLIVASGSSSASGSSNNQQQQNSPLINQLNQQSHHHPHNSSASENNHHHSTSASPSTSQNSLAFSMSPLRNKIKKASSFERFSQAQAASSSGRSTSGAGGGGGIATATITSNESSNSASSYASATLSRGAGGGENSSNVSSNTQNNEQPISLPQGASTNSSGTSAIVSRLANNWEPVANAVPPPPPPPSSATNSPSTSSSTSSFRQNVHFGSDKSHIKIPSKKLAAKIAASVFEQEQLNEAAASASLANIIIPSTSLSQHQQGIQQSSSVVQSYLNSSSSQGQSTANTNANSTLSQMLNEAPAHHLTGMGNLMCAAEEQLISHHQHHQQPHGNVHNVSVSSHENLIRELSESPLNLTENSSNNHSSSSNNVNSQQHQHHQPQSQQHHSSHSQSQSVLSQRNPVISSSISRASYSQPVSSASSYTTTSAVTPSESSSSSSSTSLLLSKKIPLTPKQKLLHRIQSGTMSPPMDHQPQQPPPPQQSPLQSLPSPVPQQQQTHQVTVPIQHNHLQQQQPSPSPPPHSVQQLSQQLHQASISTAFSSIQSTSSLQSVNLSMVHHSDQLQHQQNPGSSHLILSTGGPHSPNNQSLDPYSYDEALLRAREDLAVQEALGKIIEDPNNVNNMPYDTPETYAYYQSILNDDIFAGGSNAASQQNVTTISSRQTIQQQISAGLHDPNETLQQQQGQHSGQIEFVLGLSAEDHDRNISRADDLSLGGDGGNQQQFLDPNDALVAMKSHNQTESTLRNLLMMDSSRHVSSEDAWLLAEYQNRIMSNDFNSRSSTSSIRNGMISGGSNSNLAGMNSGSVMSINGLPTSVASNSWSNETPWQRTSLASNSSWQHQANVSVDQDEVMDMSMMEPDKGNSNGVGSNASGSVVITKRMHLHSAYGDQGTMDDVNFVSDRDLASATGLPLLQNMPISMTMDLQQPLGILQNSSSGSTNSLKNALLNSQANGIPIDLQQHHKMLSMASGGSSMDMDDQPVNLMAVNLEQELSHHSNSASISHNHHNQQQTQQHSHMLPHHLAEVKSIGHANSNSANDHSNQQGGSYTLQIHQQANTPSQHLQGDFHHSQQQQQHLVDVGNLSPVLDNIDERRIIRVKKNKESLSLGHDEIPAGRPPPNIIPDKPVQPKSHASLPAPLQLIKLGNRDDELGVFTRNKPIPPNTRFGPVEGSLKEACADDMDTMNAVYPCLILSDHHNVLWRVDREADDCCNWTKFVRMAHSIKDQNALVNEGDHDGMLYFTTCKEIPPRTELQVGFSLEYAQKYGLPYLLPLTNSSSNNGSTALAAGALDEDKISMSHLQQHQQPPSPINTGAVSSVIHGSQNFFHHQQQQSLQKNLEDEQMILNSHHNHQIHPDHDHPPQTASSSPETTSSVLTSRLSQQPHLPEPQMTPSPQPPPQPQQKSVIVETYQCFECDQDFTDVALLQQHLDKMHKEPEIRRPKKKAIKKYQQQLQQQQQNSAVSTTNSSSNGNTSVEVMDASFSFSVDRDETQRSKVSSQQHQIGKVDSSSQSSAVDSSDPLPVTKKRKAASSMKAQLQTITTNHHIVSNDENNEGSSTLSGLKPDTVIDSSGTMSTVNAEANSSTSRQGKVHANSVICGDIGGDFDKTTGELPQQMQVDGGNESDVTASQPPAKVKCTMCYKSFATKERLDRHMIVHSDEDTKPLKCPFCPKRFLTNSALAGHIKTHAGIN